MIRQTQTASSTTVKVYTLESMLEQLNLLRPTV